jgi:hypothetical protein
MKKIFSVILGSCFIFSGGHGDEKRYNNFYFGPEAFVFNLNTHFKGVKVDGTKFFVGLRLGYEYLKPNSFYFGADLLSAIGNNGFHDSFKHYHFRRPDCLTGFSNVEFRFGRTFANEKRMITPFLGFGGYCFRYGSQHHYYEELMSYLTGGVKWRQDITPTFSTGLNAKIFASYQTTDKFRFWHIKRHNHHGRWGGEIGVPLIWYLGPSKKWNIQFEPYFLKLTFAEVQNIYGTRLLFDCRF